MKTKSVPTLVSFQSSFSVSSIWRIWQTLDFSDTSPKTSSLASRPSSLLFYIFLSRFCHFFEPRRLEHTPASRDSNEIFEIQRRCHNRLRLDASALLTFFLLFFSRQYFYCLSTGNNYSWKFTFKRKLID